MFWKVPYMEKSQSSLLIQEITLSKVSKAMKLFLHWNLWGTDSVSAESKMQFEKGPWLLSFFLMDSTSYYSPFHITLMKLWASITYFRSFGQGRTTTDSLEYVSAFSKFTKLIFLISPSHQRMEVQKYCVIFLWNLIIKKDIYLSLHIFLHIYIYILNIWPRY